jgi:tetratricopeptide (TPR) repeat protein
MRIAAAVLMPLLASCDRPPSGGPPASQRAAATRPAPEAPLSTETILAKMDELLAGSAVEGSMLDPQLEVWTDVASQSASQPAQEAALRERIGRLYLAAGRPDRATAHLTRATQLRCTATAPAESACDAVSVALAKALLVLDAPLDAEQALRRVLGGSPPAPQASTPQPPASAIAPTAEINEAAYLLAEILRAAYRPHEALPFAEQALAGRIALDGEDADATVLARIERARCIGAMARVADGLAEMESIHQACLARHGARHWLTALAEVALGEAETRVAGRVQGGLDRLPAAAKALLPALPPSDWRRIDALIRSVELLESRRQWEQAEGLLRTALSALEADTRPMPPSFVPRARVALAKDLVRQKRLDDAAALAQAATSSLRSIEGRLPDADDVLADALSVSADIARRRKQFPEAHQLCNEVQEIRTKLAEGDAESPGIALTRVLRGWIMLNEEDWTGAEEELKDAVPVLRRRLGEMDWRAGQGRAILGEVRFREMRLEEAEEDIVYGSRILIGRRGADDDGMHSLRLCVDLYEAWGNTEMADHYRRMLPEAHTHDEIESGE